MQWGPEYREFHEQAWTEAVRVLRPGGRFVLNIKDHIRKERWWDVAAWHIQTLTARGLHVAAVRPIPTVRGWRWRYDISRVRAELVIALDKP